MYKIDAEATNTRFRLTSVSGTRCQSKQAIKQIGTKTNHTIKITVNQRRKQGKYELD